MKLSDMNLLDFGNTVQMVGGIYAGNGKTFLLYFPHEADDGPLIENLELTLHDWQQLLLQVDTLNVEAMTQKADGEIVKAVIRKCQRQIDSHVSWAVYRRDGFRCRYCYADNVPLTVDHLVLWEEGGPSIEVNLLSACKKCNKTRGNMSYADWLESPYYKRVSKKLPLDTLRANDALLYTLDSIPKTYVRTR